MPNLDGGHYFLTVLAPIRVDLIVDPIPGRSRSHRHQLAQKLALLRHRTSDRRLTAGRVAVAIRRQYAEPPGTVRDHRRAAL